MIRGWRLLVVLLLSLAVLGSCSTGRNGVPPPAPAKTVDYAALKQAIEDEITGGSISLDNVRAVLVSVDGQPKISHYRHGATAEETTHVWSVTKSVVSTLIGIAIADGIVSGLDDPLGELLPQHRQAMSPAVAEVTLRQLMTMSAGFIPDAPEEAARKIYTSGATWSSTCSATAIRADLQGQFRVLERAAATWSRPSWRLRCSAPTATIRARCSTTRAERLFDPLEINSRPAYTEATFDDTEEFLPVALRLVDRPAGHLDGPVRAPPRPTRPDEARPGVPRRRRLARPADRSGRVGAAGRDPRAR